MADDPLTTEEKPGDNLDEAPEVTPSYSTPPADRDEEDGGGED